MPQTNTLLSCILVFTACAADEVVPIPDDMNAISKTCVEIAPNAWQCDQGVEPQARNGSVTGTQVDIPAQPAFVYGYVYDPSGCYYCGQHSGQGLYDWAPCPWGQSIWRFHCVACNYWGNYDRILYDCGTPVREGEPVFEVTTIDREGKVEVSIQE